MKYFLTGAQMRSADLYTIEKIGLPSMVLMERAALESVRVMEAAAYDFTKVLVVCGSGNNGGDGYAIARLLHLKGHQVEIFFAGNDASRSEENRMQKQIAEFYQIPVVTELQDKYSLVIDAIFGTGLRRPIEGAYYEIVQRLNNMKGCKVAIDLPSGIHDTTGNIMGISFKADLTVAIAFIKRGLLLFPGADFAGKIEIGDIGITEHVVGDSEIVTFGYTRDDLKELFPKRKSNSHKGSYGKVLMIVGSKGMSGAAYLSAKAAYLVGAGLVQIYTHEDNRVILQQLLPEAIISTYQTYDEKQLQELLVWADVIGIGSGLGTGMISEQIVSYTIEHTEKTCVVDADALNIIAKNSNILKNKKANCIFTPHMKEMSRLTGFSVNELVENRTEILKAYVEQNELVCVMKDSRTFVSDSSNKLYINTSGNASMAKAGSGDVLTGMIAGIAAQGSKIFEAATLGTYLHGLAGDCAKEEKGSYSVLASDLLESICKVLV